MELTQKKSRENLLNLIAKFERETLSGHIKDYNEEAAKTAFIQPLLKDVLGWDVNDRDEVSPEENISRGRVDYGLKVEGKIKIFVEAKPPRANLRKHIEQAVGYGYSHKGVPFVLLTDFEEIKLFDVTVKPDIRNPQKGLKIDLRWDQYALHFDKLWPLSKESVIKGELDKLLLIKPKDRIPVDKAILEDLKRWRESLAKDLFKNNPQLFHSGDKKKDASYLKEITQKILDRIIFMRSCEDRGLTYERSLRDVFEERTETVGTNTMVFLGAMFNKYNIIFNSDLFRPQEWEASLAVQFSIMRDIVLDTYNPYQFDVIPLEVLGNIYEQYLGYTIRLTDHQVKYELKPEVRKAGGVYYTPEYIVDYIVKNTVGKMLKELPTSKIKKLRMLDPACGSGSFLIRAYEKMLDYYLEEKQKGLKTEGKQGRLILEPEAPPALSIYEKSSILKEHIFGVDLDEQAVEVTKLSLMLKMLEGEHGIIPGRAILPMLDKNIKCGNSLISGTPLELKKYFGDDWYKLKALNWEDEFPKIIKDEAGFSAVIGNPPYLRIQMMKEWAPKEVDLYKEKYITASSGNYDIYVIFIERGLQLLNKRGILGFIVPNKFFKSYYGEPLRQLIAQNKYLYHVVNFGFQQIFEGATTYTCLLILDKKGAGRAKFIDVDSLENWRAKGSAVETTIPSSKITGAEWSFVAGEGAKLFERLEAMPLKLSNVANIYVGLQTSADDIFIMNLVEETPRTLILKSKALGLEWTFEKGILFPIISGTDVNRYKPLPNRQYILFPYIAKNGKAELLDFDIIIKSYPRAAEYLLHNKGRLENREQGKFKGASWYRFGRNQNIGIQDRIKLCVPRLVDKLYATIDIDGSHFLDNVDVGGITLTPAYGKHDLKYILGLLNSRLLRWYFPLISVPFRGGWLSANRQFLSKLPVRIINFSNSGDKMLYMNLVSLVDVILDLNKKLQVAKGSEKELVDRQIGKTDREIDGLVYKLYGITDEERRIIEAGE